MNDDFNLDELGYFHEVFGEFAGHGIGSMLLYQNIDSALNKWVLFIAEDSNRVDIIDPDLYELYIELGNEESL